MRRAGAFGVLCALLALLWVACGPAEPPRQPPSGASERLDGLPGLRNVGRVSERIYRGAQPDLPGGLASLKRLGIRTVVNLRHYHGDAEEAACREAGLDYVRICLESSDAPSDEDVRRFLAIATDPARRPVYFHCKLGCDRTGTMCACYRMAVEGWSLERAMAEMQAYGFNDVWRDLKAYVEGFPARVETVWPRTGS